MNNITFVNDTNLGLSELSEKELLETTGGGYGEQAAYALGFAIGFTLGGGFVLAALLAKKALT
jgi:hypothetical protein